MRVPLAPPTRESNRGSGVVQNLRSIETLPQYGSDAGRFRVLVTIVYHGISHTTLAEHKNSVSALKQVNCGFVLSSVADGGPSPLCPQGKPDYGQHLTLCSYLGGQSQKLA